MGLTEFFYLQLWKQIDQQIVSCSCCAQSGLELENATLLNKIQPGCCHKDFLNEYGNAFLLLFEFEMFYLYVYCILFQLVNTDACELKT